MSKLNCPVVKSQAAINASKTMPSTVPSAGTAVKLLLGSLALALGVGFGGLLESSVIASLAQKETERVAILSIAESIKSEKATTVVSSTAAAAKKVAAL